MRAARAAAALLLAVSLASCGVPLSDSASPVPGYQPPSPSPSASDSASVVSTRVALWFVGPDRLVRVQSAEPVDASLSDLVAMLATAPAQSGLRTLVADPQGGPPLASLDPGAGQGASLPSSLSVRLSDTFSKLAPSDQVMLIGQVVLTVTEALAVPVQFTDSNGAPVTVPLPDGRLRDGTVSRADYLVLSRPPVTPTPGASARSTASPGVTPSS